MAKEIHFNVSGEAAELLHSDKSLGELFQMALDEGAQFGNKEGRERFKSGKWRISNSRRPDVFLLEYENYAVVFVFHIKESPKQIDFTNSHRISFIRGKGSEALRDLEISLQQLANNKNKSVLVKFLTDGQEDTKAWLEKFSYQEDPEEVEGVYGPESWSKTIQPKEKDG
ncbi:MAG: hypothetical protein HYZ51_01500 [Candidatus Doudnabacteria bacterium]|nr:hypothetical protein [Candidatus Doudnabacteria bacterium]